MSWNAISPLPNEGEYISKSSVALLDHASAREVISIS
jgi:hypothetical protein